MVTGRSEQSFTLLNLLDTKTLANKLVMMVICY